MMMMTLTMTIMAVMIMFCFLSLVTPTVVVSALVSNNVFNSAIIGLRQPSSSSSHVFAIGTTNKNNNNTQRHQQKKQRPLLLLCPLHLVVSNEHILVDQHDTPEHVDDDANSSVLKMPLVSRRCLLNRATATTTASILSSMALTLASQPSIVAAKVVASPTTTLDIGGDSTFKNNGIVSSSERCALLTAISNKSSDANILQAIENILPLSPLKGSTSTSSSYQSALDGTWKLLWYNKSDFSPLLKLPSPILRPTSYQYFGKIAEQEVGSGRVAQGLVGGIISLLGGSDTEVWLSSGAAPKADNPSILEIYPPFRFQLGKIPGSNTTTTPEPKRTIVESQSDAEFRAANARTIEAQLAPKNEYEQLYLEDYGVGSIRVSVISKGDPVIVGNMFVHQKIM